MRFSQMGERSRERMLNTFSLQAMGRRHDALYERLLAARPVSARRRVGLFDQKCQNIGPAVAQPIAPVRLKRRPVPERSVGVIVPCYRHGLFLEKCIQSVKRQTLPPAAVVVVDDGSDDLETTQALASLEGEDRLVIVRQQTNSGPSAARNRALAMLETNYVLPLDADDELLPDAIERMVSQLETAPPDIGFVYPNAQHKEIDRTTSNRRPTTCGCSWQMTLPQRRALFDRRLFDGEVAYPEDIVFGHEDWDLILQLAERGISGQPADGPTSSTAAGASAGSTRWSTAPTSFMRPSKGGTPPCIVADLRSRLAGLPPSQSCCSTGTMARGRPPTLLGAPSRHARTLRS